MKRHRQEEIRRHIQSDAVNKNVNPEKQSRHDISSNGYIHGRSYLLDNVNAQELVNRYHGTGEAKLNKTGEWKNKEVVSADETIGILVNPDTNEEIATNSFTIHYSRTGTHIVPAPRRE